MNRLKLGAAALAALIAGACGDDNNEPAGPVVEPETNDFEVVDYTPAPGQFINELPEYRSGDDGAAMAAKADARLHRRELVSLGAWGGSITLRLKASLYNREGADFRILGNSYFSGTDSDGRSFGSSEPGVVYVMRDDNKNGLPDDVWYELRGEDHDMSVADFEVTYHRPALDATDATYIRWTATDGSEGYINRVSAYHLQNFFAEWVGSGAQTFRGRRLPDNGILDQATATYRLLNRKGYADSYPNDSDYSRLDISDAVDGAGNAVHLDRIDFIKVVTGVLQCNGPLGENSTEVAGIEFLQ